MIEILAQYPLAYLHSDGRQLFVRAVIAWLIAASLAIDFTLSGPLLVVHVLANRWLSIPVGVSTYGIRGIPLYVKLSLICTGVYGLAFVRSHEWLDAFFRSGYHCTVLAFGLNTCAYTTKIFAGAIRMTPYGKVGAARAYGMPQLTLYLRMILPSALRRALPAYSNEVKRMLHASTVAFTATVGCPGARRPVVRLLG
ncbi:ABC transporter permease subunit [Mycetohabitans sp. B2]|uniref:ABC transporter permease subunit n=1 Tax=Mycetohabitans rhizoxinica TaxID=412963 RepID=A0ABZ2PRZ1_9BURK|nr:ABC transporter permease subunit [Mycetohabitans sp. B2]